MKINFQSLNDGVHIFEFDVDSSELDLGKQDFSIKGIALKSTVNKGEKNVYITSRARAQVSFVCDSCLVDFVDVLEDEFEQLTDERRHNPIFHDFDGDGDSEFVITDTHGKVFVITKAASNNLSSIRICERMSRRAAFWCQPALDNSVIAPAFMTLGITNYITISQIVNRCPCLAPRAC